ncbi:MAG: ParB N-terminal domain-containing protein, partial [Bacteroidales bacterium]|nr:ParB N-terminal domain-containing protein [Bacteroidales bacterium]
MIKIIEKDIVELIPYENNARINDKAIDIVANSIQEFGFKNPVIIDKNKVIVAGHTRVEACKKLGIDKVPCIVADDLTEEQIKAFRIADNSSAQVAEWDMQKLMAELETIDYDMSKYGLAEQMAEIEKVIDKEAQEDNYDIEQEIEEYKVKAGDVWQLGRHRLVCGDSTKKEDVEKLMCGNLADMVVTDPPYNVAYEGGTGMTIKNDNMESSKFLAFLSDAFSNLNNSLKEGGAFYVWFASREHINFETALNNNNLKVREELIWVKNALVLGRQDYQWRHEPCLYGWKEGASHYFIDDRTQTTVQEDFVKDFSKMKKEELVQFCKDLFSDKTSTT